MASGHPDWGQAQQTGLIATVADLGELAARLGSPDVFSRTGNVVYITDFEDGLTDWRRAVQGSGAAIVASTTTAYRGNVSAKLSSGTSAGDNVFIQKQVSPQVATKMGLECIVAFDSPNGYLDFTMTVAVDGTLYTFRVRYDETDDKLYYYNASGAQTFFAQAPALIKSNIAWHLFKFVVDAQTGRYVRFYLDQVLYDLSTFSAQGQAVTDGNYIAGSIRSMFKSSGNAIVYVDSAIVTINEP